MPFGFLSSSGIDRGTYDGKSLVLDGSADYLSFTPSSAGTLTGGSNLCWLKKCANGSTQVVLSAGSAASDYESIQYTSGDKLQWILVDSSSTVMNLITTAVFRDTHEWRPFLFVYDSTPATPGSSDIQIFTVDNDNNFVAITAFDTETYPSQNQNRVIGNNVVHRIGALSYSASNYYNGYMAQNAHWSNQQKTSSVVSTSSNTDKVVIASQSGFGTNNQDWLIGFNDDRASTPDTTSTIYDQSGNGNDWTGNSLTADSFSSDVPNNNHATLNLLGSHASAVFSNGNLTVVNSTSSSGQTSIGSIPIGGNGGKFRIQATIVEQTYTGIGILRLNDGFVQSNASQQGASGSESTNSFFMETYPNGFQIKYGGATQLDLTSSTSVTDGDVIDLFVNFDDGEIHAAQNGTLLNSGSALWSSLPDEPFVPQFWLYDNGSPNAEIDVNFGATDWTNSAPSGFEEFVGISSANLPIPDNWKPQDNANIVEWSGDGTAKNITFSDVSYTPAFLWGKSKEAYGHLVYDANRGGNKSIATQSTAAEDTSSEQVDSFVTGGFHHETDTGGYLNYSGRDYWGLLINGGGGSAVSNTDGSITSSVLTDGINFSIVTYTGTGANGTVGHGLVTAPDLIIVKSRTDVGQSWPIYHSSNTSAPETDYIYLNLTNATADASTFWNDTAPTSSVFSIGTTTHVNTNTETYVAYCFKFGDVFTGGSYIGNGSADGTFIPTDELLFYMVKKTSGADNWNMLDQIRDTYNPVDNLLFPNLSTQETVDSVHDHDFLSNGIKIRTSNGAYNASGSTYIWWGIKKNGGQLAA